ncbi:MAG: hypothetical protein WA240_11755 [Nitrospirota bacterium]
MKRFRNYISLMKYYVSLSNLDIIKIYLTIPRKVTDSTEAHLEAAVQWICRAQDTFNDGGVARSYSLVYNPFFNRKGWVPSYPETTGYIIPTMFDYAKLSSSKEIFERAIRMADWECDVQMENGAVQGGTIDAVPTPAIFNTGQVIFGWVRAFQETNNQRYLNSAKSAGGFLITHQDGDGAWRSNLSDFATNKIESYTYNTRTAWALIYLFDVTKELKYKEAAIKNIEYSITQQLPNGWFKNNCLFNPAAPLLHTIAYSLRGILEAGDSLKNERYIDIVKKAADALIERQKEDGSLQGRFSDKWEPTVPWICLTGVAQMAIIWGRFYQITGELKYKDALAKANRFLKRVQILDDKNKDIHGGIAGSYPLNSNYGRFEILNWAVKFFIDSLIIEMKLDNSVKY